MTPTSEFHAHRSTHREMILEHRFLGDVLQYIWQNHQDEPPPEVMSADVDDNGYDVVIEWRGILRHIQLKGRVGERAYMRVNRLLSRKPAGCIVLMTCEPDLSSLSYSWLGGPEGAPLDLTSFRNARRLRANSLGVKAETLTTCVVPAGAFQVLSGVSALVEALFPISTVD